MMIYTESPVFSNALNIDSFQMLCRWSFGNLLYEMVTLGCTPHEAVPNEELYEKLKSGYRLEKPKTSDDEMLVWHQSNVSSFPTQHFSLGTDVLSCFFIVSPHSSRCKIDAFLDQDI